MRLKRLKILGFKSFADLTKLNFDPGYIFVRVGADILALEKDTGKVADAVLNMGKST